MRQRIFSALCRRKIPKAHLFSWDFNTLRIARQKFSSASVPCEQRLNGVHVLFFSQSLETEGQTDWRLCVALVAILPQVLHHLCTCTPMGLIYRVSR
ncbi:hypothetical protein GDO78_013785 [Eleutherodactylus coqui]|uniref:Uncharacterized protein n=1 Tax=Eleutherodactylus coqui TaxID=57060 RepID=A0A8J6BFF8_ELECQ|nr:hypothetical protein GDO78_013785 [Eleutherodactylus coqui]